MPRETAVPKDTRPRVTTSKRIDLALLSQQVGVGLCAGDGEVVAAEGADISQEQLAQAVKAHKPPAEGEPVAPLTDLEISRLRALLTSRP